MSGTIRDLLILSRVPGIGPHRLRALVTHFGDAGAVAGASGRQLIAVEGIERTTASAITSFFRGQAAHTAGRFADDQLVRLARSGGKATTVWDREYPSLLKRIYDPPAVLFYRGTLDARDDYSLAIVGTRQPSPYGIQMTERFAVALARIGIPVVSGLARGIDTTAHAASIRAGNRTIAVIGSGIDIMYPPENRGLADRIVKNGAVLSEFPMGAKPDAVNFPRRNRIVSGMSLGTLVIETGTDGGAMITANIAVDQGREVFAVPAAVSERAPSGTNALLKEGKAKLTESIDDILVELAPRLKAILPDAASRRAEPRVEVTLFERRLLDVMGDAPVHVDALASDAGFGVADALVHLLSLEFKGLVRQIPGKKFVRA